MSEESSLEKESVLTPYKTAAPATVVCSAESGGKFSFPGAPWPHQLICCVFPLDEVAPSSLCWIWILSCLKVYEMSNYLSHCTSRRTLLSMQFQHLVWEVQNTEPTILNALLPTAPIWVTVLRRCSAPDTYLCPISSFRKSTHLISFLNLETFMFGAILQHPISKNSSLLFWNAANPYGVIQFLR